MKVTYKLKFNHCGYKQSITKITNIDDLNDENFMVWALENFKAVKNDYADFINEHIEVGNEVKYLTDATDHLEVSYNELVFKYNWCTGEIIMTSSKNKDFYQIIQWGTPWVATEEDPSDHQSGSVYIDDYLNEKELNDEKEVFTFEDCINAVKAMFGHDNSDNLIKDEAPEPYVVDNDTSKEEVYHHSLRDLIDSKITHVLSTDEIIDDIYHNIENNNFSCIVYNDNNGDFDVIDFDCEPNLDGIVGIVITLPYTIDDNTQKEIINFYKTHDDFTMIDFDNVDNESCVVFSL